MSFKGTTKKQSMLKGFSLTATPYTGTLDMLTALYQQFYLRTWTVKTYTCLKIFPANRSYRLKDIPERNLHPMLWV